MSRASDRAFEAIRSMILSGELPAGGQVVDLAIQTVGGVVQAGQKLWTSFQKARRCCWRPMWRRT